MLPYNTRPIVAASRQTPYIPVFAKASAGRPMDKSRGFTAFFSVRTITLSDAKEKSNLLRKIVAKKNLIQYERRSLYLAEADEIAKLASRFHQWVASCIK